MSALVISSALLFAARYYVQLQDHDVYDKAIAKQAETIDKIKAIVEDCEELLDQSKITKPKEGDQYARISVDRVKFEKPLYFGDNETILSLGIGQYMGSGLPGEGRPILLAGHNGTEFYQLRNMKKDDIVKIKTAYGEYTYKIYDMEVMEADDFDANRLNDQKEYLMMYCCYPFDELGTSQRYFAYASFVSGPKWKEAVQ